MSTRPVLSVAVVGAGPSGFYVADSLLKSALDCRIDMIESLPAPYGLIRAGVAPDHQTTKGVTRTYARTARQAAVRYYGNVEIGRDLVLDELREMYDAVILATGAPLDRELTVPGGDKAAVYGSAAFVGWYNGHPDYHDLDPPLDCDSVVVIGNGNVAVDVARVLVKTPEEMRASDMPSEVATAIHSAPIRDVHVVGRRGPLQAKFTNVELRELGKLADCRPIVDQSLLPDSIPQALVGRLSKRDLRLRERNLETLREFAAIPDKGQTKRLYLDFYLAPVEVLGGTRVEAVRFERTRVAEDGRALGTGEFVDVPCGLVIASIGYRVRPLEGLQLDARSGGVAHREGRIAPGLYVAGWAKRGPSGVIGNNKPDAEAVVRLLTQDLPLLAGGPRRPGRSELEPLLQARQVRWISFEDWQEIDAAEVVAGGPDAPRRKLLRIKDMLAVLDKPEPGRNN